MRHSIDLTFKDADIYEINWFLKRVNYLFFSYIKRVIPLSDTVLLGPSCKAIY